MRFCAAAVIATCTLTHPRTPLLGHARRRAVDSGVVAGVVTDGSVVEVLDVADPVPVEAIVPDYLERFRARGEFAAFRRENG